MYIRSRLPVVVIKHKLEIIKNSDTIKWCEENLKFRNPKYDEVARYGSVWVLKKTPQYLYLYEDVGDKLLLPIGVIKKLMKDFEITEFKNLVTKDTTLFSPLKYKDNYLPKSYQEIAINTAKLKKLGVIVAPCGSGKTNIGLGIAKEINKRCLWITHTQDLTKQAMKRAKEIFVNGDYGLIMEGKIDLGLDITFATIQTLSHCDLTDIKDKFGLIIIDECHHCIGSPTTLTMYYKVLSEMLCTQRIGLTATPERADNLEDAMHCLLGETIHEVDSLKSNISLKTEIVSNKANYNSYDYIDYSGSIDYNKLVTMLGSDKQRQDLIEQNIRKILKIPNSVQLVLCDRVAQVEDFQERFKDLSVNDALFMGGNIKQHRNLKNRRLIVASTAIAYEGLDVPELNYVHITGFVKQKAKIKQILGRVQREAPNKTTSYVEIYLDENIPYSLVNATRLHRAVESTEKERLKVLNDI